MTQDKHTNMGRTVFWGIASVLLLTFLIWAFMPSAVLVDVALITQGTMTVRVEAEGRTRVKEIYAISAPVAGRLMRIEVKAGDAVTANQTRLAVIEPAAPVILDQRTRAEAKATAQAAEDILLLAQSDVQRTQAQLAFAQSELERAQRLSQNGTISVRDLDMAKLDVATHLAQMNSAQATAKVRQHELETARARLLPTSQKDIDGECCVVITAPVNGKVLRVLHESEGGVVVGEPLLEIGNPRDLEIVVDLLTSDAARINEGAQVVIENWGGPQLQGTVQRIEPFGYTKASVLGIEEQRVDAVIAFEPSQNLPSALGHGFRVEVGIQQWQGDTILMAPLSAMFRVQGGWAVYVIEDGKAQLTPIEVGHMNGHHSEIISGLSNGNEVVLHPSDRVSDGTRVAIRKK